ncbi:MAG: M15 family metallopeptidase [Bacteroidia bacterium]|nr:M15 family metallopeptidase [Bacteroidia bacterium]
MSFRAFLFISSLLILLNSCQQGEKRKVGTDPTSKEQIVADQLPDSIPDTVFSKSEPTPVSAYEQTMIDSGLVDVQTVDPNIRVDLKYSTTDNFMGMDVYGDLNKAFLRPLAAQKLGKAQQLLHEIHPDYNLKVFDGCRPRRVQFIMWDTLDIPFKRNYVANPWEGSIHNYGMAVDLTIVDGQNHELDMGTPFDFFGPLAQPQLEAKMLASGELKPEQVANRDLLRDVMRRAGFFGIHTEWWHFLALLSDEVKAKYKMIE